MPRRKTLAQRVAEFVAANPDASMHEIAKGLRYPVGGGTAKELRPLFKATKAARRGS